MVRCDLCATTFPGEDAEWDAHYLAVHMAPLTPTVCESQALGLIKAAARSDRTFTIFSVIAPLGPHPEPDRRQSIVGILTRRLSSQGLIEAVGAVESTKPSTNASLVKTWRGKTTKERAA